MTSDDFEPENTTDPSIQVINPPIDNDGNVVDVDGRKIDGIHWKAGAEANMIFGTSWDDVLEGGAGADTSHGLEGNDLMKGKGGFDN
jgi:Ca2+-binding RTX toxin-like protein